MELDGSLRFAHRMAFDHDQDYELVFRNNRPFYYRRKSYLYHWDNVEIEIEPLYPCGLKISPKGVANMADIDMKKVRELAILASPVLLRGFRQTKDLEVFKRKASEMGPIMPWKFGDVLVVKDEGAKPDNGGLNNVLNAEAMPMHFDGLFKTKAVIVDGMETKVPQAPQ